MAKTGFQRIIAMRTPLIALLSFVSAASVSFAAEQATGTVKTFNPQKMTLSLDDGTDYTLPASFKDPGLKPGEKVSIAYKTVGEKHEATAVSMVQ
jgi:Protein of unknown function (DUF1344)